MTDINHADDGHCSAHTDIKLWLKFRHFQWFSDQCSVLVVENVGSQIDKWANKKGVTLMNHTETIEPWWVLVLLFCQSLTNCTDSEQTNNNRREKTRREIIQYTEMEIITVERGRGMTQQLARQGHSVPRQHPARHHKSWINSLWPWHASRALEPPLLITSFTHTPKLTTPCWVNLLGADGLMLWSSGDRWECAGSWASRYTGLGWAWLLWVTFECVVMSSLFGLACPSEHGGDGRRRRRRVEVVCGRCRLSYSCRVFRGDPITLLHLSSCCNSNFHITDNLFKCGGCQMLFKLHSQKYLDFHIWCPPNLNKLFRFISWLVSIHYFIIM